MQHITARIESGDWPAGTILPAEVALAREFQVSVGTVRRALGILTADGLLARRRKTGTVVTGRTPRHSLRFYYDFFRLHSRSGDLQNSIPQVLHVGKRPPTQDELHRLALPDGEEVLDIHRLRVVSGRPVMHERIVLPTRLVPGLGDTPQDIPDRIYPMLWTTYGLKISAIREEVEADLADQADADLLGLTSPAAILVINETAFDEMARPILLNSHRASTRHDVYINEIH